MLLFGPEKPSKCLKTELNFFIYMFCPVQGLSKFINNVMIELQPSQLYRPQNRSKFCFFSSAKVLRESRGSSAEEFCYFDGRSGLPTLCISAMILVALQNNSLIDVLFNRKYFLFVKLIFSVFILRFWTACFLS